ncbi:MAG: hypothetical protein HN774_03210 [Bacteroidetes Order II. Incertae sedis bacterium]|nr:hypothetical protein [Bacteroidetes Order II. bacterium]
MSTVKVTDETGASRGVEIVPSGCEPVSEDVCKSGFMAPAENVSFPQNALKQCCKCRKGETCALCADPSACTDEEKEKFVGIKDCFGMVEPEEEEEEEETEAEAEAGSVVETATATEVETKSSGMFMYYAISACCVISIVVFMMSRGGGRRNNMMY